MTTVLRTMWGKAVVVRIWARRVFVLGTVLASLLLVALPRALALDPALRLAVSCINRIIHVYKCITTCIRAKWAE